MRYEDVLSGASGKFFSFLKKDIPYTLMGLQKLPDPYGGQLCQLVSNCYGNKWPPTGWLKTTQMTLLKFRRSEASFSCVQGDWQGCACLEAPGEEPVSPWSSFLEPHSPCAGSSLRLRGQQCSIFRTLLSVHMAVSSSRVSFCSPFMSLIKGTLVMWLGLPPDSPGYPPYLSS